VCVAEIVTLLLASQPGTGFASPRWLAEWGTTTLLGHALAAAHSWPLPLGLVVIGSDADAIVEAVDFGEVPVLVDPEWAEGEAASLRAGLDYLQRLSDVDAVLLADADTPAVRPEIVPRLVAAFTESSRPAAAPKYRYSRGRPFILDRELWPRFLGLEGDADPDAVLATHDRWVEDVWFDHLAPVGVATPQQLEERAPRR
jgi:molybdenum cofactor cytidylyltransferase